MNRIGRIPCHDGHNGHVAEGGGKISCESGRLCWIDGEGTEWHAGTHHGVYVRFKDSEAVHFLHSGDEWGNASTGLSIDARALIGAWSTLQALKA